jgi:hypothetical protein
MNGLILRLFFHGLIAFVPNGSHGMDAYLVNHKDHLPVLMFEMTEESICPTTPLDLTREGDPVSGMFCFQDDRMKGSSNIGSWCICQIAGGVKISLLPQSVGPTRLLPTRPEEVNPETATGAADFAWLVSLTNLQDSGTVKVKSSLNDTLVSARMNFKWLSERSCHLDQLGTPGCMTTPPRNCRFRLYPFRFVSGQYGTATHQQVLSEYATFEVRLPPSPRRGNLVLEDQNDKITLDLGCGVRECPSVLIGNISLDQSGDSDQGEHFLAYYNLAQGMPQRRFPERVDDPNALAAPDKQLFNCRDDPFRKRSRFVEEVRNLPQDPSVLSSRFFRFLLILDGLFPRAVESRIICPPARLDPP